MLLILVLLLARASGTDSNTRSGEGPEALFSLTLVVQAQALHRRGSGQNHNTPL
jgi:hypothetical protein